MSPTTFQTTKPRENRACQSSNQIDSRLPTKALDHLSMELKSGVGESSYRKDQTNPAVDHMSLDGNARRLSQQVQIRPAVVLAHAETPPFLVERGSPFPSPQKCPTALGAHHPWSRGGCKERLALPQTKDGCYHTRIHQQTQDLGSRDPQRWEGRLARFERDRDVWLSEACPADDLRPQKGR